MYLIPSGVTLLLSVYTSVTVLRAAVFTGTQQTQIEEYVESVLRCRNIPGITLSVVKGEETWARGYGMADLDTGRRVDNDTVFAIGSLGKAFTMVLLGSFLQQNGEKAIASGHREKAIASGHMRTGRMCKIGLYVIEWTPTEVFPRLADPEGQSPRFKYNWYTKLADIPNTNYKFADEERTRELTVSDLLSHRTGLSAVTDYGFIGGYPNGTTKQTMAGRLQDVPATRPMRENFIYNNLMYMLFGHVTETLGVDSWEHLVTSHLLEPIGMGDTTVLEDSDDVLRDVSAKPYIFKDGQMQLGTRGIYKLTPLEPAGSIMSTGSDMAKWMRFNLHNATSTDGVNIVEPGMFVQAFQEQMSLSFYASATYSIKTPKYPVNDVTSGYGFAWFTSNYRDHRKVWHSGGLFSYISLVWLYPDQAIGIFASTNGPGLPSNSGTALNTIFYFLSDMLLGFDPWLDPETACTFPSPWSNTTMFSVPPQKEFSNDQKADFVGTYGSHLLPDVTVTMDDAHSLQNGGLHFEMNRIKGDLFPTESNNTFGFQMSDPWEYAIERVFNENFTIRYPVEFIRSAGNDVIGFNISFESSVIIPFRKDTRFHEELLAAASALQLSWLLTLVACYVPLY